MLTKIKTWWTNSKLKTIFDKIGKAVRQFLRYAYAAQLSYLVLAVLFYLKASKFFGVLLIAWGVVLLIAEIRQKKAEKKALADALAAQPIAPVTPAPTA
jgi:asparagine N-glycosylation enzyme membrane subunit Stt3